MRRRFGEQRVGSGRDLFEEKAARGRGLGGLNSVPELIEEGHRSAWECLTVGSDDEAANCRRLLLCEQRRRHEQYRGSQCQDAFEHAGQGNISGMKKLAAVFMLAYVIAFSLATRAQQTTNDGPRYTGTALVRPTDYREWVFLSSGLGMTYEPPTANPRPPTFGNVFVNPSSYRSFMQTGKWPDKTIFVLEFRNSASEESINKSGRFQTGLAAVEAEVKDARFPDGWGFFTFTAAASAEPMSATASAPCVECHTKNTAVERTFVQFYPTLLEVARRMGTVKPGF